MAKKKISIIDDEERILTVLREYLSTRYEIETHSVPEKGLEAIKASPPDLIILDLNMPGMSGFEVFEELRAEARFKLTPILFLTAISEAESMQKALELGANDYINKPIRLNELQRRIDLRFGQVESPAPIQCGNLTLDPNTQLVILQKGKKKLEITLPKLGFTVLHLFLKHPEQILSREQIIEWAWGNEDTSDRAVDVQISRLRSNLSLWDHDIFTEYGSGYSLKKKY